MIRRGASRRGPRAVTGGSADQGTRRGTPLVRSLLVSTGLLALAISVGVLTAIAIGWPSVIDEWTQPPAAETVDTPIACAPGSSIGQAPAAPGSQEADTSNWTAVPALSDPGVTACHASAFDRAF